MTDRGHQSPAAFLIMASGLDKVLVVPATGHTPGVVAGFNTRKFSTHVATSTDAYNPAKHGYIFMHMLVIYICIYIHILSTYIYIYIHIAYLHVCVCVCIYIYIYVYIYKTVQNYIHT